MGYFTPYLRHLLLPALSALLLLLASCGGGEEMSPTPASTRPGAATPVEESRDVPGVTDTEIKLGIHIPLSQNPAAAYAPIAYGMRAYFDYVNDTEGGVYGRKLTLIIGDDHYNPPDSLEVVRKLVEQDKVFAIVGGLGEATHNAVWKYLEERGVPDMFLSTGLRKWTEPVVKSRFGGNPDYVTEGRILGMYIAEHYNGKKLGLLLQNDEFGDEGERGLLQGLEGSDVEVAARETYESVNFDMTAQTQRLKNAGVGVIAAYTIPPQGASLVKVARETLNWDVPIIVTGVDCSDIFVALAGPENAEGVISVVFANQIYETDHPGVKKHIEVMQKHGGGEPPSNFSLYGQLVGEMMVEALKNAGPNLTRDTIVQGAEAIRNFQCSVCIVPINLSEDDHRPFETEVYNRVEDGKWVPFGEPVSFESTIE